LDLILSGGGESKQKNAEDFSVDVASTPSTTLLVGSIPTSENDKAPATVLTPTQIRANPSADTLISVNVPAELQSIFPAYLGI